MGELPGGQIIRSRVVGGVSQAAGDPAVKFEDAQPRRPRSDHGVRGALRVNIASRDHITTGRTAAINALIALLRVVDPGVDARGPLNATQITAVAAWRSRTEELSIGSLAPRPSGWPSEFASPIRNCPTSPSRRRRRWLL